MESLIIEGTSYTPDVRFDVHQNEFVISGDSRPEDTHAFYKEIISWLENFGANSEAKEKTSKDQILFKFQFDYLNSSSSKFVLKLLMKTKELIDSGFSFKIDWYYDDPDLDMKELGEEYAEMADININLISVEV